ncbi:MAG: polysaccharide biosynthesis protein [Lachnospiraceae bacterium]|nr:polysaccharide biosynthesis protein [Lachnospiraceae bacterium]
MNNRQGSSRISFAKRNIAFGYLGMLVTAPASFVLRTIFIHRLSDTLLGINSTYANILSILSMAELGIGTALNYSLYEPAANHDTSRIKSYMRLYRRSYHVIGLVVAVLGILLSPFLQYLVKNPGGVSVGDLRLYYFIFLFNTVSTYFVSYKYSLVNAEQKNYIQTNIITATKLCSVFLQIIVLLLFRSFLLYLLADAFVQLVQKVFVSIYLDRMYPYLKDKDVKPLEKAETNEIKRRTGAVLLLKVGDAARLQTDALIISSMIAVAVAGVVDNYQMIVTVAGNFINIIFNSVVSGFGNLVAKESRSRQYDVYRAYRLLAVWLFGYITCGMYILISPLIRQWLGPEWLLPSAAVFCMLTDFYLKGDRNVLNNFRAAAGIFEPDRFLPIIMGIVNLILSVWLCRRIGVTGIYIGTVVSGLIGNIVRPVKLYRACFDRPYTDYFRDLLGNAAILAAAALICRAIALRVLAAPGIGRLIVMGLIVTAVYNGFFIIAYRKKKEFRYLADTFGNTVVSVKNRLGHR